MLVLPPATGLRSGSLHNVQRHFKDSQVSGCARVCTMSSRHLTGGSASLPLPCKAWPGLQASLCILDTLQRCRCRGNSFWELECGCSIHGDADFQHTVGPLWQDNLPHHSGGARHRVLSDPTTGCSSGACFCAIVWPRHNADSNCDISTVVSARQQCWYPSRHPHGDRPNQSFWIFVCFPCNLCSTCVFCRTQVTSGPCMLLPHEGCIVDGLARHT